MTENSEIKMLAGAVALGFLSAAAFIGLVRFCCYLAGYSITEVGTWGAAMVGIFVGIFVSVAGIEAAVRRSR